jgi:predicted transcriptional regulator
VHGKGRPHHLWELSVSPLELVRELENDAKTKQVILANAVKRIRAELGND